MLTFLRRQLPQAGLASAQHDTESYTGGVRSDVLPQISKSSVWSFGVRQRGDGVPDYIYKHHVGGLGRCHVPTERQLGSAVVQRDLLYAFDHVRLVLFAELGIGCNLVSCVLCGERRCPERDAGMNIDQRRKPRQRNKRS